MRVSTARRAVHLAWLVLAAAVLPAIPAIAAKDVPRLSGRVNDTAQMIPPAARDRLERKLAAFEDQTGAQVVVLTVASLDGELLASYSIKVAQTWKLGRKDADDGVLLLIARDDRAVRIEVGYGLEPRLTDAHCRRIVDNVIRPAFRGGDFGGGVEAGVDAILGTLQGKDVIPASAPSRGSGLMPPVMRWFAIAVLAVVLVPVSLGSLCTKGKQGWIICVTLTLVWVLFPFLILGTIGLAAAVAWLIGFPIGRLVIHHTRTGKRFLAAHPRLVATTSATGPSWGGGWGGDGASGGGGFSGSGGFSGGGGSFGGGGSSGSW